MAEKYPKQYNQSTSSPKDNTGKVKKTTDWTLNNYIDITTEIGIINLDVKKISHTVRDFRNYTQSYSRLSSSFSPDMDTTSICFQVLKATINQIVEYIKIAE